MPMRILSTATLLSLALPLCGEPTLAQQTQVNFAVSGGVATDQRGVQSSAIVIAPTVMLQASPNAVLQVGGSATRFATELWSVGGSAALSARRPLGPFVALTLNASGSASRLASEPATAFAIADVIPALEANVGVLALHAGMRAAGGRSTRQAMSSGPPPIVGGARGITNVVSSGSRVGPVFGGTLRVQANAATLRLGASHEPADGTTFDAAVSLPLASSLSLDIGAGRYPANGLLETPAGTYATAGLSLRVGGASRRAALPRPVGVGAPRAGMTRLAIRAPDARGVEVAGDFTDWEFVATARATNGVWYVDLRIPPGQYRYAFRIDGAEWRVPDGATAVDDGFGGTSAWITVPGRRVGR
jgi:hypothetical protein